MRKILIILVFVFTFQSLCFGGNLKIEETNFDLRAATFPPPPRPCVFEGISYDMDSRFYELSEDGNPVLTKGQTGYIDIYLSLSGDNCGDVEKTVNVSVENENCISFTKRSVVTRDQTASFNIKALKEGESYVEFSCEDYTISLYFTVVPGSDKYQVMIYKKNSSIIAKDTWSFSSNGNFNSSNLGLSGTWKDLGDDSFSIKIDQKK